MHLSHPCRVCVTPTKQDRGVPSWAGDSHTDRVPPVLTWSLITHCCMVGMRLPSGTRWKEEMALLAFYHVSLLH